MAKQGSVKIRNSTAEFLVFAHQAKEDGIEVRVQDNTVWLTQKLIALLF
jgi:RNA:NAD 2'-phosphotransferase (TPT1/KptA family)